jgi:hypothetical protein
VALFDCREILKNSQYSVLNELHSEKLVSSHLMREISTNIESVFSSGSVSKNLDWIHLTEHADCEDQLIVLCTHEMLNRMFDHDFRMNQFFRNLSPVSIINLVKSSSYLQVSAGEFVYHSGQVSNSSRLASRQFLSSSKAE